MVGVLVILAGCRGDDSAARGVIEMRTVEVASPGNSPVGIVPFQGPPKQGIYESCSGAPAGCQLVGAVDDEYRIGELEVTVAQYVAFLNTVDPDGRNEHGLYVEDMSPSTWPKYGSIRRSTEDNVPAGDHYSVAFPQWASKTVGLVSFLSAARFVNSLWTITPAPMRNGTRAPGVWRRLHGGVANARAYRLWISAIGEAPQTSPYVGHIYPWLGFRVGVIGDLGEATD